MTPFGVRFTEESSIMKSHWWSDLTTLDFASMDMGKVVAVLPVGATEQHGPHLPVKVDAAIAKGIVRHAVAKIPDGLPVLVLPTQAIGKSDEHAAFRGTLTLSAETLARVWFEICTSVYRSGVRRVVFVNSHGGQPQIMDVVCRRLRVEFGMLAVSSSWSQFTPLADMFSKEELDLGIHAGEVETSMMCYLDPDRVEMKHARNFVTLGHHMAEGDGLLLPEGSGIGFGWQMQDLHPMGAAGDASKADAERGRLVVERAAEKLAQLLREVAEFELDTFKPKPDFRSTIGADTQ